MTVREVTKPVPVLPRDEISITVGVHAAEAGHSHGEGQTIGDIASWQEFGTQTIPARSFVRGWFDERQDFIRATLTRELQAAVAGKRTPQQALERCALAFEGDVKQRILTNIPPPLKPATIARKGSSLALVDTGALRNAIRAEVKRGSNGSR